MVSLLPARPCIRHANVFLCRAQDSSSPGTLKIDTMLTKQPKGGAILLAELRVDEVVTRQSRCSPAVDRQQHKRFMLDEVLLEDAYERCRCVCAEYAKTFYLGLEPNISSS